MAGSSSKMWVEDNLGQGVEGRERGNFHIESRFPL